MKALGSFLFATILALATVFATRFVEGAAVESVSAAAGSRRTRNDNSDPSPFWAARGKRTLEEVAENVPQDLEEPPMGALRHFSPPNPLFSNPKPYQRLRMLSDPYAWYNYDDPAPEPYYASHQAKQAQPQFQHISPAVADYALTYSLLHKPTASKKQDAAASADSNAPFWAARG